MQTKINLLQLGKILLGWCACDLWLGGEGKKGGGREGGKHPASYSLDSLDGRQIVAERLRQVLSMPRRYIDRQMGEWM